MLLKKISASKDWGEQETSLIDKAKREEYLELFEEEKLEAISMLEELGWEDLISLGAEELQDLNVRLEKEIAERMKQISPLRELDEKMTSLKWLSEQGGEPIKWREMWPDPY